MERNCWWIWTSFNLHLCQLYSQESLSKVSSRLWAKVLLWKGWFSRFTLISGGKNKKANDKWSKIAWWRGSLSYQLYEQIWRGKEYWFLFKCIIEKILREKWLTSTSKLHQKNENVSINAWSKETDFRISIETTRIN